MTTTKTHVGSKRILSIIIYPKSKAVSGPRECNPTGPCCASLEFVSDGSLASGGQSHTLGKYYRISDGPVSTWNYQMDSNFKAKLWYNPTFKVSFGFLS